MGLEDQDLQKLAERLIERLSERERILTLASNIARELSRKGVFDPAFARSLSGPGDAWPVCPQAHVTYQDSCSTKSGKTHSCGEKGKFSCAGDWVYKCDLYDCPFYYSCGQQLYDHVCDDEFKCPDFLCNGAHTFLCSDDYICQTSFTCRSCSNNKKCIGDYSRTDGKGRTDKTSGDFECGDYGGSRDIFSCLGSFRCRTTDQFDCQDSTTFTCGDAAGDNFECTAGGAGGFICGDTVSCVGTFTCAKALAPYAP